MDLRWKLIVGILLLGLDRTRRDDQSICQMDTQIGDESRMQLREALLLTTLAMRIAAGRRSFMIAMGLEEVGCWMLAIPAQLAQPRHPVVEVAGIAKLIKAAGIVGAVVWHQFKKRRQRLLAFVDSPELSQRAGQVAVDLRKNRRFLKPQQRDLPRFLVVPIHVVGSGQHAEEIRQ